MVLVKLYSILRVIASSDELNVEAESLGELLRNLIAKYGREMEVSLMKDEGTLNSFVQVFVNRACVRDLTKKLGGDDTVELLLLVDGG